MKMAREAIVDLTKRTVTKTVETRKPGKRVRGAPIGAPDSIAENVIDFSGVPDETVFELAARTVIITEQTRLRASTDPADWSAKQRTIDVADMMTRERVIDPKQAAQRQLSRMAPEEREAFLKEVLASMKKK